MQESRSKMVPVLVHLLLSLLVVEGVHPVGLAVRLRRLEGLQLIVVAVVCLDQPVLFESGEVALEVAVLAEHVDLLGVLQFDGLGLLDGVEGVVLQALAEVVLVLLEAGHVVHQHRAHLLLDLDLQAHQLLLGEGELSLEEGVYLH